jgi:hypothetical protein
MLHALRESQVMGRQIWDQHSFWPIGNHRH